MLGEVIFGGVGAGMYGILVMIILTVFIAGLMVGRTPEYLGKKIEAYDIQMAMLYVLIFPLIILVSPRSRQSRQISDLHLLITREHMGFRRSFMHLLRRQAITVRHLPGINANTLWYNTTLGVAMLVGRFMMISTDARDCGKSGQKKDSASKPRYISG